MEHRAALWGKCHIRDISIAFKGLSSRSLWNSRWAGLETFDEPCDMCTMHRNSFSSDSCDSIKVSRTPVIFAHSIHLVTGCTRNEHNTNQYEVILTFEFDGCDGSSPIKKPGHLSIDDGILQQQCDTSHTPIHLFVRSLSLSGAAFFFIQVPWFRSHEFVNIQKACRIDSSGHTRTQTIENITQKMDAIRIDLQARLIHRFHGINRLKCDQNKQHLSGFCFCLRAHDSHSPGHSGDFLLIRGISNARERYKMHREPRRLRAKALKPVRAQAPIRWINFCLCFSPIRLEKQDPGSMEHCVWFISSVKFVWLYLPMTSRLLWSCFKSWPLS